jgi:hypothetical protein
VNADLQKEIEAHNAYTRWLTDAVEVRRLYVEASLGVPSRLKLVLGDEGLPAQRPLNLPELLVKKEKPNKPEKRPYTVKPSAPLEHIPAKPDHGPKPEEAGKEWVSLRLEVASPQALTMAAMRHHNRPLEWSVISNIVARLRGMKGSGAAYNVLARLEKSGDILERENGWVLKDTQNGGLLTEDYLWTPLELMTDYDKAAHRREGILLLLEENKRLLTSEIIRGLEQMDWIKTISTQDFVKSDMYQLEKQGIIRRLETKEWEIA